MTPDELACAVARVAPPGGALEAVQVLMLGPDMAEVTVRVGGDWYKGMVRRDEWRPAGLDEVYTGPLEDTTRMGRSMCDMPGCGTTATCWRCLTR